MWIEVQNAAQIGGADQWRTAALLTRARAETSGIEHEFPLDAAAYTGKLNAFRHFGRISSKEYIRDNQAATFVVRDEHRELPVVGLAKALRAEPLLGHAAQGENVLQFAYWHVDIEDQEQAATAGAAIINKLLRQRHSIPGVTHVRYIWMLTHQGDAAREAALGKTHFMPSAPVVRTPGKHWQSKTKIPYQYDVGDNVTEPRILWVHEI